ncbi:MAG: hypothetical protein IT563_06370 [Alphaproteobacteria bacterium]|nr:hypothetical protein [Alphaproteobacteria bacterium]
MWQSIRPVVVPIIGSLLTAMFLRQDARAQTVPAEAPTRKSAAVISVLGDRVIGVTVGLTVFQNDHETIDTDWGVDSNMVERLSAALGERYDMKSVAYDRSTLLDVASKREVFAPTGPLVDALRKSIAPGTVDRLFVVRTSQIKDPFSGANVYFSGYGVYAQDTLIFGRQNGFAFLNCFMVAIDGRTMKTLKEHVCSNDVSGPVMPHRKLEKPMTKAHLPNYSPEQLGTLRDLFFDMVVETIPLTLKKLNLAEVDDPKPIPERPPQEESTR